MATFYAAILFAKPQLPHFIRRFKLNTIAMNTKNWLADPQTLKVCENLNLDKFLYIEWNSEQAGGGAGLGHIRFSLMNLLNYYVYTEKEIRSFIFSNKFYPHYSWHSCTSVKTVGQILEYFDIPMYVGKKFNQLIPVYYDYKGLFKLNFKTEETIGLATLKRKGLSDIRKNNLNIVEVDQCNVHQILPLSYNFYGGGWFNARPSAAEFHKNVYFNGWGCFPPAKKIKYIADEILINLKKQADNNKAYVMHLRRGDRLGESDIAGSSDPSFIEKCFCNKRFEKGSSVYIMTNGETEYVDEVKEILKNQGFKSFSKNDFSLLAQIGQVDNFELFQIEQEIGNLADQRITNRKGHPQGLADFSLLFEYRTQTLLPKPEYNLIPICEENESYMFEKCCEVAYGNESTNLIFKLVDLNTLVMFNDSGFNCIPSSSLKRGFLVNRNCKGKNSKLTLISNENEEYVSSNLCQVAYGTNNHLKFQVLSSNTKILFDNKTFGDVAPFQQKYGFLHET